MAGSAGGGGGGGAASRSADDMTMLPLAPLALAGAGAAGGDASSGSAGSLEDAAGLLRRASSSGSGGRPAPAAPGASAAGNGGGSGAAGPLLSATHFQAAIAVQGSKTLWRAAAAEATPAAAAAAAAAAATKAGGARLAGGSFVPRRRGGSSLFDNAAPLRAGDGAAGAAGSAAPAPEAAAAPPPPPEAITPDQIQAALEESTSGLMRLSNSVRDAQAWVRRGGLADMGAAGGRRRGGAASLLAGPWSSFLGAPHLDISGVAGAIVRVPLHAGWVAPASPRRGIAQQQQQQQQQQQRDGAGWGALRGRSSHVLSHVQENVRSSTARVFASGGASLQLGRLVRSWLDFTRLTVRLDLGLTGPPLAAAAGAGGAPPAPTAAAAAPVPAAPQPLQRGGNGGSAGRLFGAPSPAAAVVAAGPAPAPAPAAARHPAFALDNRGTWHALSLSASQQLLGPLRLRADARYALDSPHAWPGWNRPPAAMAAAAAAHVLGMRPQCVDGAVGLDLTLPGTRGAGRLVAWYAPMRREGALELRLF